MKSGDWIRINFLGQLKATGEVFDLTKEEDAKRYGLHDEKKRYGPVLVIISGGMIMRGVERQLLSMRVGETREFDVSPGEGAGQRQPDLIKVFSYAKFIRQKITPFPGLVLNVDGRNVKILSVAGGRVRVDYNHPLAGKELHYTVEIVEQIKDPAKMIESLLQYYDLEGKAIISQGKAAVSVATEPNPMIKKLIEETLKKFCPGVESVKIMAEPGPGKLEKTVPEKVPQRKA